MGFFGWFKGRGASEQERRLREWRDAWAAAVLAPLPGEGERLLAELDAIGLAEDDVEIEREMVDGLIRVSELTVAVDAAGLPTVETGHRAVGTDTCHFTAPASMPDEPSQPSGRLLLTSSRAIFLGGAGAAVAWHAFGAVLPAERGGVLIRNDKQRLYRFRCNSYGDALAGVFLGQRLVRGRRDAAVARSPKAGA